MLFFGGFIAVQAQSYTWTTWAENVACIFYTNCTRCHYPGGPGPFSLIDYPSAFSARFAIKDAVQNDYMPPWSADENYQTYAHERLLTQTEKDIIVGWVDGGAVQGNLANAPVPPSYSATGSALDTISFAGNIGNYTNSATVDDYRVFLIPTHLGVDKFIEKIELIPGTRSMVHHALIYYEEDTNALIGFDNADAGMGYTNYGGTGVSGSKLICTWTPGSDVLEYPNGMGVKLPANAYLVVQVHYPQGTTGDTDSNTTVNLKFASGSVREVNLDPILNYFLPGNITPYPLYIGANSSASFVETYTIPSITPFPDNFTILNVLPHMHKVGQSIKVYAIKPGNDTIPLINIPDWDFKWQGQYTFRQPIVLPEGTVLKAEATFNNTFANTDAPNPNNPVSAGEASDEEMMLVYFSYLYAFPGDENIIVDTVTVKPTYMGCNFVGIEDVTGAYANYTLYPNPSGDFVNVSFEQFTEGDVRLSLIDLQGKVLAEYLQPNVGVGAFTKMIDVNTIPSGLYYIRAWSGEHMFAKPLIITR